MSDYPRQELLARYYRRLLGLARAKLRGKFDPNPPPEVDIDPNLPSDVQVSAKEAMIQHLLERLGNAELRSIAVWKWQGYTNEEIAAILGCTCLTIERKLELIRAILGEEDAV